MANNMTKICELCKGNDYINIRQIWENTEEKRKIWIAQPCPLCIPKTENDIQLEEARKSGL
jgi:hypothetical protein